MKFGENLKKLRKNAGLSQEELADKVKVSRQSVSKWETGEAYPEMNNILQLCKIFNCEINSLVNDNMVDLDSLDEEIKMKVVKLKEDKQKRLKILSKIIYTISKIGKICLRIGMVGIAIAMIVIPILGFNIKSIDDHTVKIFDYEVKYERDDYTIKYAVEDKEGKIEKQRAVENLNNLLDKVEGNEMTVIVCIAEFAFICLEASLLIISLSLGHIEKLFRNIPAGDTPFTFANVTHIKKMAYYMIALIILPSIGGALLELITADAFDFDMNGVSILTILVLFTLSYVFEYGYEIQLDSNGKIYGDSDE